MRLVALMPVFNEADILEHCLRKLLVQEIEIVVFDNHSTDESAEIAHSLGIEVRIFGRPDRWKEEESLAAMRAFAQQSDADWFIYHAADEIFCSDTPGEFYRDAVESIAAKGFNAIDHELREYVPIDNTFVSGFDHECHFRRWTLDTAVRAKNLRLVRTWKSHPLAEFVARGHEITFPDRKLPERSLIIKHYPIRSQAHGERKVFEERIARGDRMTFSHYNQEKKTRRFLRDPAEFNFDPL